MKYLLAFLALLLLAGAIGVGAEHLLAFLGTPKGAVTAFFTCLFIVLAMIRKKKKQDDDIKIPILGIIVLSIIAAFFATEFYFFVANSLKNHTVLFISISLGVILLVFLIVSLVVNLRMKKVRTEIISLIEYLNFSSDIATFYQKQERLISLLNTVRRGQFLLLKKNRLDEKPSILIDQLSYEEDLQVFNTIKRMYEVYKKKFEKNNESCSNPFAEEIEKYFYRFCQENKEEATECLQRLISTDEEKLENMTQNIYNSRNNSTVSDKNDYSAYTVYFTNGHLSKIDPYPAGGYYENRDIANSAKSIISDGVTYDLTDEKSIASIPVPKYGGEPSNGIGVTGFLEYVLRMRSGRYWNECQYDLAIACLEKATHLMKFSPMGWAPKDFFRIVNELNDLGQFKKAEKWKKWIKKNIPGAASLIVSASSAIKSRNPISKQELKPILEECKYLDTDLVEVGDCGVCCEVCARYRNRIYTLTGKDLRFPKFPSDFHNGCGLGIYPYIWNVSEPSFSCSDPIEYSNRPFIDDRTDKEKESRITWTKKLEKQPEIIREPSLTRIIYYRLKKILPNDAPKSLSGFSRMRNANSKNYQALVKKAVDAGFVFPNTLEEVAQWPENQ